MTAGQDDGGQRSIRRRRATRPVQRPSLACGRVVEQVASGEGNSPTKQEKVGGLTFVAPDLLYALSRVGVELSDDIGKAIL